MRGGGRGRGRAGRRLETHSYATFDTVPPGQGPLDPVSGRSQGTALGVVAIDQLAETFRFGGFQGVHVHIHPARSPHGREP